ncbi:MAG: ECF transporter S component [Firmicutes bacterium]|nr:ECF transporter S component [Bacillota bacterium]
MKDNTTKKIVFAALLAALACVATMIIKIPTPLGGYIHAGDAVVVLAGFLLGPVWGALAAGLGSCLADVISGYVLYAPGTFVIKAVVALLAGWIIGTKLIKNEFAKALVAGIIGGIVMVGGYMLYEAVFMGFGVGAAANIPMNCIQGAFGAVAGAALYIALSKTNYFNK